VQISEDRAFDVGIDLGSSELLSVAPGPPQTVLRLILICSQAKIA
jgi:hypothetical protein